MQAPARQPSAPVTLASSSFLPSRQSIRQDTLAKKDVDEVVEFIKRNENPASDSEDEVLLAGSSRIRTNFQRLLSSSNEEEAEVIKQKQKKKQKKATQKAKKLAAAGSESGGLRTVLSSASKHSVPLPQQQLTQQQQPLGQQHPAVTQSAQDNLPIQQSDQLISNQQQLRQQDQWQQIRDFWDQRQQQTFQQQPLQKQPVQHQLQQWIAWPKRKEPKLEVVLETIAAYEHDRQDLLDLSEEPRELI